MAGVVLVGDALHAYPPDLGQVPSLSFSLSRSIAHSLALAHSLSRSLSLFLALCLALALARSLALPQYILRGAFGLPEPSAQYTWRVSIVFVKLKNHAFPPMGADRAFAPYTRRVQGHLAHKKQHSPLRPP